MELDGTLTRFNLNRDALVSLQIGFLWEGGEGRRVPGDDWWSAGVDCLGALVRDRFPKPRSFDEENLGGSGFE